MDVKKFHIIKFFMFFVYFGLFLAVYFFISYVNQNVTFCGDDVFNIPSFAKESVRYGNCLWLKINWLFVFYLPKILGIHYNSWIGVYNILRAGLYFFISFYIAKFINLNLKSHIFHFIACIIVLTFILKEITYFMQYVETAFVIARYTIPLLIMIIAFYLITKNIIHNDGLNKKYIILSTILILLLVNQTEIFVLDSALFLFFLSIYSLFKFKKLIAAIIFPSLGVLTDLVIYWGIAKVNLIQDKMPNGTTYSDIFYFLDAYKKYCIDNIQQILISLLIVFVVYFIIIFFNRSEKNIKYYVFALIITILNFLSLFSLYKFDVEFYFTNNIKLVYDLLFFIPIFLLFNIEMKPKYDKIIKVVLLITLVFFMFNHIKDNFYHIKNSIKDYQEFWIMQREIEYKYQKILRLYSLRNIPPKIYVPQNEFLNIGIESDEDQTNKCIENNVVLLEFMNQTYNIEEFKHYGLCFVSQEEAEQLYKDIGVYFYPGEIEKSDFQKLKDDNFVLNKNVQEESY